MSEFMTQLRETDTSSKKQFNVLAEKIHELAGAIVGVQSATRVAVDDSKQNQKQTHRTLENMLWQLAGPGKAVNQSMKDVVVSSAKMIQQVEQHLSKNIRTAESAAENMENMENHLAAISGHLQKLVELQSKSTKTEDPKASAKLPPPPVAPAGMNVPPQVAPASMTVPQATLGTAAHPVQPKLMPSNLTPPMPSGFSFLRHHPLRLRATPQLWHPLPTRLHRHRVQLCAPRDQGRHRLRFGSVSVWLMGPGTGRRQTRVTSFRSFEIMWTHLLGM